MRMVAEGVMEALEAVKQMCKTTKCEECPFSFKLGDTHLCTLKGEPQEWVITKQTKLS